MGASKIPGAVIRVVSEVLGPFIYNHRAVDSLFVESGAPGEPPTEVRNCSERCEAWLKRSNDADDVDAFAVLGAALHGYMQDEFVVQPDVVADIRTRITNVLRRNGLSYETGGHIRGPMTVTATPSRSFENLLRSHDFHTVGDEFQRAIQAIEVDPAAALTAACATLESIFLVYLEDEGQPLPAKKTIGDLWQPVRDRLGLAPKSVQEDDLKRILGGLASIVDGIGAFRTHAGSAHGRERKAYKPRPRHARLAVHAAHTLGAFIIDDLGRATLDLTETAALETSRSAGRPPVCMVSRIR